MLNLFRAEWTKAAGHRWATSFLIWIFPAAALVLLILLGIATLVSTEARADLAQGGLDPWDQTMLGTWVFVNNEFGRYIILVYAAIIFAGEYQHGTWKNLIPRRPRLLLILTKFVTLAALVVTAFLAMSIIVGVGAGILASVHNLDYGLPPTAHEMQEFIGDYALQMFITLSATFIAIGYVSFAAMLTRSIVASAIVAILVNIAETGILLPLVLLNSLFGLELFWIYQFTPGYSLANISSWINQGHGYSIIELTPFSLTGSLIVVIAWMIGLVGLTILFFRRQDITS